MAATKKTNTTPSPRSGGASLSRRSGGASLSRRSGGASLVRKATRRHDPTSARSESQAKTGSESDDVPAAPKSSSKVGEPEIRVRRIHRRDLNKVWEFLKLVFREVNRETVEYQRPRTKKRFLEVYEEEGVEQLIFEAVQAKRAAVVGYAECAFEVTGNDSWINERYFRKHKMRPLFVEELAVHPDYQGRGVGGFMLEQLEHLARLRGLTHLVLEVAENNDNALRFYRSRSFMKLDAAIFLAKRVATDEELLPPRHLKKAKPDEKG